MISLHFPLLLLCLTQDLVSCSDIKMRTELLTATLGDSLTLNCTYNCSTGFVRGCWSTTPDNSGCHGTFSKSSVCTVSLHLSNVSTEDLQKSYTCYTENTEDPHFTQITQRVVSLQLEVHISFPRWTLTPQTETKNATLPAKPKDLSGETFTGMKVLATVTVAVALLLAALAAYLCLNRNKQSRHSKGELAVSRSGSTLPSPASLSLMMGSASAPSERVALRIPTPDNGSDTEVPYADIMITVRGVSTPELTQIGYLAPGDQKEWWGDEPRSHLQASRSADRLHVLLPREVSRKMSTNSEYAVITYA
ncbi:uncharacterized protein LOC131462949 isoform X2 [Solea solea]|uniref:uncharacterized protein LOC131462949 isoform X2 n=1 Tax=Solea solea TaxID=90069 RepID=UPI00272D191D|nr:uncharacterized protein LOC131462949 isoform X2 [Solea solea]